MSSELLEYARRNIHNGVASALTRAEIPCNSFCKAPIHCDVWYTQSLDTEIFEELLQGVLGSKAELLKVHRTTEAYPQPPNHFVGIGIMNENLPIYTWLVFWKLKK